MIDFKKLGLISALCLGDTISTLLCTLKYGKTAFFKAEINIFLKFLFNHIGYYSFLIMPVLAISGVYGMWIFIKTIEKEVNRNYDFFFWMFIGAWIMVIFYNLSYLF